MPTLKFVITAENEAASKAIKQFANDVGASVDDVAKKSKKSTEDQRSSLTQLTQGYQSFRTFAVDAIEGVKKVWDFAKEGAQIEEARRKMDRLAESIGTTGEALRSKLGEATGGLLSNAEQIQMGTDLMSLGLAKTSDQVVRLTNVSSKLGMDMNQLVLTLANQTTMRFDQLGVSVDGFDERLQELKDSGMDVNDAFTEAFLQQAEEQITRVGDATDTTIGKMKKAEAAIKNATDAVKEFAAQGISAGVDLVEMPKTLEETFSATVKQMRVDLASGKMTLDNYNAGLKGLVQTMEGVWRPAMQHAQYELYALTETQAQSIGTFYQATGALNMQELAEQNVARVAEAAAQAEAIRTQQVRESNDAMAARYNAMAMAAQKQQEFEAAQAAAAVADAVYRGSVAETAKKVDDMAQSLAKATDAQAKQMLAQSSLDAIKQAYENGTISQEGFNRATDAVLLRYDLATPKSLAMAEAQQKITDAFLKGDMPLNNYITAAEKIPQIADDGTVTLQELASVGVIPTTNAVKDQDRALKDLRGAWDRIPRSVKTVYTIETHGSAPSGGASAPNKSSGYATGADFIVPQGYSDDSYQIRVKTGERVLVQTPMQQTFRGGGITVAPGAIVIQGAGQNAQAIAREVIQELGRVTNGAIGAGMGVMGQ